MICLIYNLCRSIWIHINEVADNDLISIDTTCPDAKQYRGCLVGNSYTYVHLSTLGYTLNKKLLNG